jgi:putative peptidoglycan lipid II flippase
MYRTLFKNCSALSAGLTVGRLSGLVKVAVAAAIFGTSDSMDSFLVAMALPTVVLTICVDAVYVATVKLVSRHKSEGRNSSDNWREVSSLFNFTVLTLTAFAVFYSLCSPHIVRLVAPGFSHQKLIHTAVLARCVAPVMVLVPAQHVFIAILHVSNRFAIAAFKFFLPNLFVILAILTLSGHFGIASYAVGSVAGELVVCFGCYLLAKRAGVRYSFSWGAGSRGIRESVRLGASVMACVGALQVMIITDRAFASGLPNGSVSALGYAMLLLAFPISLVRTVVDAAFPSIAGIFHKRLEGTGGGVHLAKVERDRQLAGAVRSCFKLLAMIAMPVAIMLLLWRKPLISLVLERGKFDAASAASTAVALFFYCFALVPMVMRHFLTRLSQSFGDSLTPLPSNITCTASNIGFNFLLVPFLGHAAIALSLALGTVMGVSVLYLQLRRRIAVLRTSGIEMVALKVIAAAGVMVTAYVAARCASGSVLAAGIAAMTAYGTALLVLGVVGVRHIMQWQAALRTSSA